VADRLSPGETRARLRRPRLTGRTMLLAAMALLLVVILAPALQTYLNRRASVSSAAKQQRELAAKVAQLQGENNLWQDPAYVERQARARLQYIRPGDTLYSVLDAQGKPLTPSTPQAAPAKVTGKSRLPTWNAALWSSVQDAAR